MAFSSPRSILRKKMLRQTLSGWKQFLAIVLMGAIATTLFVGLTANAESLSERVETFYSQGDTPDLWVLTSPSFGDQSEVIAKVLDYEDTMDTRFEITNKVNGSSAYGALSKKMPTLSHPIETFDALDEQSDEHFFLIDKGAVSKWTDGDLSVKPGSEVTVSYSFANLNLDSSVLNMLDRFVKPGKTKLHREKQINTKATVTGLMTFPENIQTAAFNTSTYLMSYDIFDATLGSLLYENYSSAAASLIINYLHTPNEYLIKVHDQSTLSAKKEKIESALEEDVLIRILDRELNPWSASADMEVKEARQLTFVFPVVFFLVALLVILTTFTQIIIKERTQIGTFKALGLTNLDIYWHYISLVLTLITIATGIGCVIGPFLLPAIMAQKYDLLYTLPQRALFYFPWWQALLTYLLFALSGALMAILSCYREVRLSPVESMRSEPIRYKARALGNLKGRSNSLLLSVKMAMRNIRVSLKKSISVIIGVMGCTALLVCGYGIENTLNYGIGLDLDTFYNSGATISYSSAQTDEVPAFASNPHVKSYDQYFQSTITASTDKKTMTTSLRLFNDSHPFFIADISKEEIVVTTKVVETLGVKEGDMLSFTYNGKDFERKISRVHTSFSIHGIFGLFSDFPEIEKTYSGAWASPVDGVSIETLCEELTAMGSMNTNIQSVRSPSQMITYISDALSGIFIMTKAVRVFAILLAVVVLYNLALLNFREHARDIATLKVLGFQPREIALSLMTEVLSLTFIGIVIGLFVGYPFMQLVLVVNKVALVEFIYHIYWYTYLFAFILTFLVAFLVNLYLAFMTKKVKMVESLKSVE